MAGQNPIVQERASRCTLSVFMPSLRDRLARAYSACTGRETRIVPIPMASLYSVSGCRRSSSQQSPLRPTATKDGSRGQSTKSAANSPARSSTFSRPMRRANPIVKKHRAMETLNLQLPAKMVTSKQDDAASCATGSVFLARTSGHSGRFRLPRLHGCPGGEIVEKELPIERRFVGQFQRHVTLLDASSPLLVTAQQFLLAITDSEPDARHRRRCRASPRNACERSASDHLAALA